MVRMIARYRGQGRNGLVLACSTLMFLLPFHRYQKLSVQGLSQMGKTSFTRRQRLRNHDAPLPVVASFKEVLQLAQKYHGRTRGSKKYLKGWRHWRDVTVESIRQDLSSKLPHPVEDNELAQLSFDLGVAADKGQMPSFSSPGARSGYALDYFCRARLLAGLFVDIDNPTLPTFWTHNDSHQQYSEDTNNAISFLTGKDFSSSSNLHDTTVHLTSVGGGPGFDFVAAALAVMFSSSANTDPLPALRATILDYEEGWESLVDAMNESTSEVLQQPTWRCDWGGKCDITKPLNHGDNTATRAAIETTHVWTCQYCVAENANKLRASDYIFFRELWTAMPEGSIFIITETTPRLWPEFHRIVQEHCPFMQVSFPNQKGPQLLLRKSSMKMQDVDDARSSIRVNECLKEFEEIATLHEQRLSLGWERQEAKKRDYSSEIAALR
jgi:hypothetical protein